MKKYLTKEKKRQLEQELEESKTSKRFEIGERLKRAKDMGDLSENADYTDAKDAQLVNEKRILELEDILHSAEVIEESNNIQEVVLEKGHKIAQMLIQKFEHCDILEADKLSETVRGHGREGSTGHK